MSDISNISVSTQNIVLAINNLTNAISKTAFKAPNATGTSIGTAAAAGAGAIRFVTDATSTLRYSIYAGGGGNTVIVFSNGSAWLIL